MSDEDGRINMNGSRVCVDYLTFYVGGVARYFFVRSVSDRLYLRGALLNIKAC